MTQPTTSRLVTEAALAIALAAKAALASPALTGTPTINGTAAAKTTDITTAIAGVTPTSLGLGNVNNTSDASKPLSTAATAALAAKADLVGGVVPSGQIPAIALTNAVTVANQAAMLALTTTQVQPGDVAVRTDGAGTFILTTTDPTQLGNWVRLNAPTDVVTSVNGQQGTVVLAASDVGAAPSTLTATVSGNTTAIGQISFSVNPVTLTAAGNMTGSAFNLLDATSGAFTATLPAPSRVGQLLVAERVDTTTNLISFGGTIRGVTATATMPGLGVSGESFLFVAESLTSWRIAATHKPKALLDLLYASLTADPIKFGRPLLRGPSLVSVVDVAQTAGAFNAAGASFRIPYKFVFAATDVQLLFANWYYVSGSTKLEAGPGASLTVKAAIEYNGTTTPVYFNNQRTITLDDAAQAWTDPIALNLPAGAEVQVRVFIVAGTNSVPQNSSGGGIGVTTAATWVNGSDVCDATGAMSTATSFGAFSPIAVVGSPLALTPPKQILGIGDSVLRGQGDSPNSQSNLSGWWPRWLNNTVASQRIAGTGDLLQNWASNKVSKRLALAATYKNVYVGFGTNDIAASRTLAQLQADFTTLVGFLQARGARVWLGTLPPRTTSTDSWVTTGNQTVASTESVRVALNTWIRTAPLGVAGYFEIADACETARNSGLWVVNGSANYGTPDGIHPAIATHTAIAAALPAPSTVIG